jgi:predicted MPP superfamily phosphohydrolase
MGDEPMPVTGKGDMPAEEEHKPSRFSRRRFLKLASLEFGGLIAGSVLDSFVIEPRWVKRTRPVIAIDSLPPAWDGVRIAHLTDLHAGKLVGLDYLAKVVEMTIAESPDVIVLTGDYVTGRAGITPELGQLLAKLRAPGGRFAVLGNHDYWASAAGVVSLVQTAGIPMLTNGSVLLDRKGEKLCLAGVDDLWEGRPLLDAALAGVDERLPRILLCHNPDYAEEMPGSPRVDLMLCGHTHGGQFKIPFGPRLGVPLKHVKYAAGLSQGPRCRVYTSVGLGMVGIPIRFNCRPELAIITLRRGMIRAAAAGRGAAGGDSTNIRTAAFFKI